MRQLFCYGALLEPHWREYYKLLIGVPFMLLGDLRQRPGTSDVGARFDRGCQGQVWGEVFDCSPALVAKLARMEAPEYVLKIVWRWNDRPVWAFVPTVTRGAFLHWRPVSG